jgi:hypothetical protein
MIGQLHKLTQKSWVWKFNCEQKRGSRLARAASKVGQNHWAIASSTTDTRTAKINLGMVETACALNLAAIQWFQCMSLHLSIFLSSLLSENWRYQVAVTRIHATLAITKFTNLKPIETVKRPVMGGTNWNRHLLRENPCRNNIVSGTPTSFSRWIWRGDHASISSLIDL